MQVTGLPILPVSTAKQPRHDTAERLTRGAERDRAADNTEQKSADQQYSGGQSSRARTFATPQRVESTGQADELNGRRLAEDENLSYSSRRALQIFAENTPSPEQRLGIELAGVNLYA